jgi:hypothetical protein
MRRNGSRTPHLHPGPALLCALVLALCLVRLHSHLLFHGVVEIFTIAVACAIFFFAWHARRFFDNHYVLLIGIASLFIGVMDSLHALAYRGMRVLPGDDANLPTQLWIAGRWVQSLTFLAAPLFLRRKLNPGLALGVYAVCAGLAVAAVFAGMFPDCFVEGAGLTSFKIGSEYAITLVLLVSAVLLWGRRGDLDRTVLLYIAGSILLTMAAELAFTLYADVYGPANVIGHLIRFVAACMLYRAIIVTGLVRPYDLLFRDLTRSEDALRKTNAQLEATVADLQRALAEVKTLSGLLPICANCKKIRDDRGYWTQVESYIGARAGVSFSHGICPECLRQLYPDYYAQQN